MAVQRGLFANAGRSQTGSEILLSSLCGHLSANTYVAGGSFVI
jgi:hypothetical protein